MILTYKQTIEDAKQLAKLITKPYDAIHGIPAGGISIMVAVAQELGIDNMLSVDEYKEYPDKEKVLVVDDLVDSGKTLLRYPLSDCAVVYKKPHSPEPMYYYKDIGSEWVTFPHEKDKDGILDHLVRIFSFIDIRLSEQEEQSILNILKRIKEK